MCLQLCAVCMWSCGINNPTGRRLSSMTPAELSFKYSEGWHHQPPSWNPSTVTSWFFLLCVAEVLGNAALGLPVLLQPFQRRGGLEFSAFAVICIFILIPLLIQKWQTVRLWRINRNLKKIQRVKWIKARASSTFPSQSLFLIREGFKRSWMHFTSCQRGSLARNSTFTVGSPLEEECVM